MRITVIGGRGQVARALAEQARPGLDVVLLGRPTIDLEVTSNIASCIAWTRPDVIVNAAAYTNVESAESEADKAYRINATGAGAVAAAAARLRVPLVHLSTEYVFDGSKAAPYTEADPPAPLNVYGRSKLEGEEAVASATPDYAILRTSWLYGPYGQNFVAKIRNLASTQSEIDVVSDRSGAPTSVLDLAVGIEQVARNLLDYGCGSRGRGIFHMTCAGETSWAEFATRILYLFSNGDTPRTVVRPIHSSCLRELARRPANSRLDNGRLNAIHGISLPDWREALSHVAKRMEKPPPA